MVVQLKKEYKKMERSPTFYSWVYLNAKESAFIIQGMLTRIERLYKNQYNVIQFFEKGIDQPIHEHKP